MGHIGAILLFLGILVTMFSLNNLQDGVKDLQIRIGELEEILRGEAK